MGLAFGFGNGIMFGVYILGFWYGTELIIKDGLEVHNMLRAVMCLLFAGMGMGQASMGIPNAIKAKAACHDIFTLVDREPPIDSGVFGREDLVNARGISDCSGRSDAELEREKAEWRRKDAEAKAKA